MSKEFPDCVDPWKAAEGQRIFRGSIALAKLPRLAPMLAEPDGEATFSADFGLDGEQRALIDIEVSAELPLVCQASLERYLHAVHCQSTLMAVETEMCDDAVPEHYDMTLAVDGRVTFAGLVEDELLLALPQVPRKPGLGEVAYSSDQEAAETAETYKPFAGLGSLIEGRRTNRKTERD